MEFENAKFFVAYLPITWSIVNGKAFKFPSGRKEQTTARVSPTLATNNLVSFSSTATAHEAPQTVLASNFRRVGSSGRTRWSNRITILFARYSPIVLKYSPSIDSNACLRIDRIPSSDILELN